MPNVPCLKHLFVSAAYPALNIHFWALPTLPIAFICDRCPSCLLNLHLHKIWAKLINFMFQLGLHLWALPTLPITFICESCLSCLLHSFVSAAYLAQVVCVSAAHHAGPDALVPSLREDGVGQARCLPALHVRLNPSFPQLDHVRRLQARTCAVMSIIIQDILYRNFMQWWKLGPGISLYLIRKT